MLCRHVVREDGLGFVHASEGTEVPGGKRVRLQRMEVEVHVTQGGAYSSVALFLDTNSLASNMSWVDITHGQTQH